MKRSTWWATPSSAPLWFSAVELADSRRYHGPLGRAAAIRAAARLVLLAVFLVVTSGVVPATGAPTTFERSVPLLWVPAATALLWWLPGFVIEAWFQFVHEPRFGRPRPIPRRFVLVGAVVLVGSAAMGCAVSLAFWTLIDAADPTSWWIAVASVAVAAAALMLLDRSSIGSLAQEGTPLSGPEAERVSQVVERLGLHDISLRLLAAESDTSDVELNACSAGAFGPPRLAVTRGLLAEDPALLEFVVTHEAGHLELGHHRASFLTAAGGALAVVCALAGIVGALHGSGLNLLEPRWWPLLWLIVVALSAAGGFVRAFVGRAQERAADRYAIDRLAVLPPLSMVRRLHVSATADLDPGRLARLAAPHPTPAERLDWLGYQA